MKIKWIKRYLNSNSLWKLKRKKIYTFKKKEKMTSQMMMMRIMMNLMKSMKYNHYHIKVELFK